MVITAIIRLMHYPATQRKEFVRNDWDGPDSHKIKYWEVSASSWDAIREGLRDDNILKASRVAKETVETWRKSDGEQLFFGMSPLTKEEALMFSRSSEPSDCLSSPTAFAQMRQEN